MRADKESSRTVRKGCCLDSSKKDVSYCACLKHISRLGWNRFYTNPRNLTQVCKIEVGNTDGNYIHTICPLSSGEGSVGLMDFSNIYSSLAACRYHRQKVAFPQNPCVVSFQFFKSPGHLICSSYYLLAF